MRDPRLPVDNPRSGQASLLTHPFNTPVLGERFSWKPPGSSKIHQKSINCSMTLETGAGIKRWAADGQQRASANLLSKSRSDSRCTKLAIEQQRKALCVCAFVCLCCLALCRCFTLTHSPSRLRLRTRAGEVFFPFLSSLSVFETCYGFSSISLPHSPFLHPLTHSSEGAGYITKAKQVIDARDTFKTPIFYDTVCLQIVRSTQHWHRFIVRLRWLGATSKN